MKHRIRVLLANGLPTKVELTLPDGEVVDLPVRRIDVGIGPSRRPGRVTVELAVDEIVLYDEATDTPGTIELAS